MILAAPFAAASWQGVTELTPSQLASILAAIATPPALPNHLETGGAHATAAYLPADGGGVSLPAGTDSSGRVVVTTGAVGGSGDLVTVTFAVPFASAPTVTLSYEDGTALALKAVLSSVTANGFTINVTAAAALTAYAFDWIAVGAPN